VWPSSFVTIGLRLLLLGVWKRAGFLFAGIARPALPSVRHNNILSPRQPRFVYNAPLCRQHKSSFLLTKWIEVQLLIVRRMRTYGLSRVLAHFT
jgi:hypothetical protein